MIGEETIKGNILRFIAENTGLSIPEAMEKAYELGRRDSHLIRRLEDIDKEEILKAVVLLDLFTKTFCRYRKDYERFDDLKFRCDECPFQKENGECLIKIFKHKYAPDYRDFGSMGDL